MLGRYICLYKTKLRKEYKIAFLENAFRWTNNMFRCGFPLKFASGLLVNEILPSSMRTFLHAKAEYCTYIEFGMAIPSKVLII